MEKFRGKKRYFSNLWRQTNVEEYDLDFGDEGWFDLWHTHLDFLGYGNNSLKIRREHIKAHLALYRNLLKNLQPLGKPYQCWIELIDEEAALDAVYIHTPNPNEDNFPLKIDKLNWDCDVPKYFKDLINPNEFNVGHYMWGSKNCYIIQSQNNKIEL
ncbi:hypothetical protein D1B31_01370 [Neobacillus notoginsengisoli]|uniref:Uncharacterized protein n=1 Tax=Neobacillus notoginsengisoli TaxID=1578198 RepID=A0A417Z007_9BACI|nr:hypothetical protein [Neobacillus notoginsengisoli]RHW43346.1 hypothetical protein D1B31_01370 [Neobacillus notoginsengisoli]